LKKNDIGIFFDQGEIYTEKQFPEHNGFLSFSIQTDKITFFSINLQAEWESTMKDQFGDNIGDISINLVEQNSYSL
jgi:hypothetical protein